MAKKKENVKGVIETRLIWIDNELETLTPGSEEFSRSVKDISALAKSLADLQNAESTAVDNEAKREEQKRMNDKEIEFKEAQLEIEETRVSNESANKLNLQKIDIARFIADFGLRTLAQFGYFMMAGRVMRTEYELSGGTSMQAPTGIRNQLNDLKPRKPF